MSALEDRRFGPEPHKMQARILSVEKGPVSPGLALGRRAGPDKSGTCAAIFRRMAFHRFLELSHLALELQALFGSLPDTPVSFRGGEGPNFIREPGRGSSCLNELPAFRVRIRKLSTGRRGTPGVPPVSSGNPFFLHLP